MFDYTDAQVTDAIAWGVFLAFLIVVVGVGCLYHGLTREWRQFLKRRRAYEAWRALIEGGGK